ncbi:MAG: peptide-methionine (S)-S-oxide reductase MsrA [Fimbriimonadaceae bacterium]|nr:peptide-methionine (S)-S-oxide reductase MsrA [Fimbriimonadaceae bacterium]
MEAEFRLIPGVVATGVGYTGGNAPNPTYQQVCAGGTGHAEAVQVEFDPSAISYAELLGRFFDQNDPTRGRSSAKSQYRMAVFTHGAAQEQAVRSAVAEIERKAGREVVASIEPAREFHLAEEYHQRYFEKAGRAGTCSF